MKSLQDCFQRILYKFGVIFSQKSDVISLFCCSSFLSVITNTAYLEYSFYKAVLVTLKKDFQKELSFMVLSSTDRGGLLFSLSTDQLASRHC